MYHGDDLPPIKTLTFSKLNALWTMTWSLFTDFPIESETYNLNVFLNGSFEPLPVGEGVEIQKGQNVVFDPGL